MRDIAKEAYESTVVGNTGWMRPDAARGETIEGFQSVVLAADLMQLNGLIKIKVKHLESESGKRHIDMIQFTRLG